MPDGWRIQEVVDADPQHGRAAASQDIGEVIGEAGLARSVDAVDADASMTGKAVRDLLEQAGALGGHVRITSCHFGNRASIRVRARFGPVVVAAPRASAAASSFR